MATIDDLIKEIAVRHGIAIGKDDPLVIVHTLNEILLQEGQKAQQETMNTFKAELEDLATRWSVDAKEKAERVLNASLAASKDAMASGAKEAATVAASQLKGVIDESQRVVDKTVSGIQKASALNLLASALVLIAAIVVLMRH
jgi:hypothetical protein